MRNKSLEKIIARKKERSFYARVKRALGLNNVDWNKLFPEFKVFVGLNELELYNKNCYKSFYKS